MTEPTTFRGDIQGLRAIAILPVVVYHAWPHAMPGGFVGVDIFFVISGFLITGIVKRELDLGQFSILRFYERRVRRLFPALFLMLAVATVAAVLILPPLQLKDFARSGVATIFFSANAYFLWTTTYFGSEAELRPLLHAWSLGVEEQFYLAFPIFLYLMVRFARRLLVPSVLILGVASLALSHALLDRPDGSSFYLPFTRAFELLIGALLALNVLPTIRTETFRNLLALGGLLAVAASFVAIDRNSPFPGLNALLPCVGTAGILYAGSSGSTLVNRALTARPLTFFGDISYALYLWHWPFLGLHALPDAWHDINARPHCRRYCRNSRGLSILEVG